MFNQLVESRSHRAEARRKSRFFLGTLGLYALLLAALGVVSVYAYDVHLDGELRETAILISPPPLSPDVPATTQPQNVHSGRSRPQQIAERPIAIRRISQNTIPPETVSVMRNLIPEMPTGPVKITDRVFDPEAGGSIIGPPGPGRSITDGTERGTQLVRSDDIETPAPPTPTPAPIPKKPVNLSSLITSKVISKPVPPYPTPAKLIRAQGPVTVEILVDEGGRVISARATSGHPLLRLAAQQAALQARFSPTILGNQPVKVTGVITYNFVLQ
ncbi:MAG: energy transducer TonB [Acidobacteriota bacterium]|nr:energy transducer TonB [Acidobacteriota bacterium]